jgi:putative phage-type endonuclease
MKILDLQQGSPEWLAHRALVNNASEAPAMTGVSPHTSRGELLRMKQSGNEKEFSDYVQKKILDRGHDVEEFARPLIEAEHGIELFPATVTDNEGWLGASLDGITLDQVIIWECKSANKEKLALLAETNLRDDDYAQIQQQLLVTGASYALYTLSDLTEEGTVTITVYPDLEMFEEIRRGWQQFEEDLLTYEAPVIEPKAIGTMIESLPYLGIQIDAKVIASNIDEFKAHALAVFDEISTDLQTDQDFADADLAVKFCQSVEDRLKSTKDGVLAQAEDLYKALTAMDDISGLARQKRLDLGRLIKDRKESRKSEIQQQAVDAMAEHVATINKSFDGRYHVEPPADFRAQVGQGMKNKRTVLTWMDAADQVLADAKIAINQRADLIRANLVEFKNAENHRHLFADWKDLIEKPTDDFVNVIKIRIAEHEKAEQDRLEAERERIREEELAKAGEAEIKKADDEELQTEPEAATPARTNVALTEYQRGYVDGLTAFAWWKSGEQFVGTSGTTLNEAIKKFLASGQH